MPGVRWGQVHRGPDVIRRRQESGSFQDGQEIPSDPVHKGAGQTRISPFTDGVEPQGLGSTEGLRPLRLSRSQESWSGEGEGGGGRGRLLQPVEQRWMPLGQLPHGKEGCFPIPFSCPVGARLGSGSPAKLLQQPARWEAATDVCFLVLAAYHVLTSPADQLEGQPPTLQAPSANRALSSLYRARPVVSSLLPCALPHQKPNPFLALSTTSWKGQHGVLGATNGLGLGMPRTRGCKTQGASLGRAESPAGQPAMGSWGGKAAKSVPPAKSGPCSMGTGRGKAWEFLSSFYSQPQLQDCPVHGSAEFGGPHLRLAPARVPAAA